MKLDFNKPVLGLDDQPIEGAHLGKLIANIMAASSKGDAIKQYDMARKLYKGEVLDLDRADQKTLKDIITESDAITNLTKAQALEVFDKDKSEN